MKQIRGMWFPDGDQHFKAQLAANPLVDGRGTYQHKKYIGALPFVRGRGHAVDIGAHVGLWSRLMAIDFERVTSFEPMPEHLECFRANLAGVKNIRLHEVALSDAGPVSLKMPHDNTGNTHVADDGVPVETRTLDSYRLREIDFLKIDVEGFELPVLLSGEKTIKRERPTIIIEQKPNGNAERYGRGRFDALDLLKSWGAVVQWEISGDFLLTFP